MEQQPHIKQTLYTPNTDNSLGLGEPGRQTYNVRTRPARHRPCRSTGQSKVRKTSFIGRR